GRLHVGGDADGGESQGREPGGFRRPQRHGVALADERDASRVLSRARQAARVRLGGRRGQRSRRRAIHDAVMRRQGGRPFVLLGLTVKGRGVSFMESVPIWHYRSPNKEEYAKAIAELTEVTS